MPDITKQHYVPRMLLKRFSYSKIVTKKKTIYMIYQYDKDKNVLRKIDIYDACRKDNIYEIKDENGIILDKERNLIENGLGKCEERCDKIIDKICHNEAISEDEELMMALFISLQLLRTPETISTTKEWLKNVSYGANLNLSENQIDRYVKLSSLVHGVIEQGQMPILDSVLKNVANNKKLVAYCSRTPFVLNGDRPVLMLKPFQGCTPIPFLPIASNWCVALVDEKAKINPVVEASCEFTNFINKQNFLNDGRFIYSSFSILDNIKNWSCN